MQLGESGKENNALNVMNENITQPLWIGKKHLVLNNGSRITM
jgi:hypothetical protein